jgi:predicted TIM-barrel fold metal-dependent hydrolase
MSTFIDVHCHLYGVSHIPMLTVLERYGWKLSAGLKLDIKRVRRFVETAESETQEILTQLLTEVRKFLADKRASTTIILTPLVIYFEKEDKRKLLHQQASDLQEAIQNICALPENANVRIYPFIGIDPTAAESIDILRTYIKRNKRNNSELRNGDFIGVKIYPPLNVDITRRSANRIFKYCERHDIPITTHGSDKGFISKNINKGIAEDLSNPGRWKLVFEKFPNLRVNFAHFGGLNQSWIDTIKAYITEGRNVYTDVAYQLATSPRDCVLAVKEWMENPMLASRVLFGTDYYSTIYEVMFYRTCTIPFKKGIGKKNFTAISDTNPRAFLRL